MRTKTSSERAFVTQLVENTNTLVRNSKMSAAQKTALIQAAVQKNAARIAKLRDLRTVARTEDHQKRVDRWIQVRAAASAYLLATAKWILHTNQHAMSIRQRPRMFADPSWANQRQPSDGSGADRPLAGI